MNTHHDDQRDATVEGASGPVRGRDNEPEVAQRRRFLSLGLGVGAAGAAALARPRPAKKTWDVYKNPPTTKNRGPRRLKHIYRFHL